MRRVTASLLALLLVVSGVARAEPQGAVELAAPRDVEGLLLADANGDGLRDLLLLEGRALMVYLARKGELPGPKPDFGYAVPEDVSFVDAAPLPEGGARAGLVLVGRAGYRRLDLAAGTETPLPAVFGALAWADAGKATFARFAGPDGSLLVPTVSGWHLVRGGEPPVALELPLDRHVRPPGDFLEDAAEVTVARPHVLVGPPPVGAAPDAPPTLWALAGRELLAICGAARTRFDLSFLPAEGERRLLDLDGDGAPEVIHKQGTNQEGTYAFFRPRTPALDKGQLPATGPDLRPPVSVVRLTGFQLPPEFVDLDGDGRLDFVITTIAIDARNTLRALGGKVTASTKAFLNKERAGGQGFFATAPDADITSDIGVAIRFSQEGNIDVRRSFTIVVSGDYDGDGRKDLAIRTAPDTLTVHRGVESGVWSAEGVDVAIPPLEDSPDLEGHPADLAGDGKDELVLLYRHGHEGHDRLRVIRPLP
jgi:hypothetical protein